MTVRSQPSGRRPRRSSREASSRRTLYVNLTLGFAAVLGVIALVGAAAATYADQHFASVAKVNGTSISKDQSRDRLKIETFRITQAEAQLRDLNQLGRLSDQDLQTRLAALDQQSQSLSQSVIDRLVDVTLQKQLAAKLGISISDAQIDQRLLDEATRKEQRHIFEITVSPEVSSGASGPTDTQKEAARNKAEQALTDIRGGKSFEEVAKSASDDGYASSGGDTGWALVDDTSFEANFLGAVFKLEQGGLTDVIEGADGSFRIGKVTEISTESVDPDWVQKITGAGIPLSAYQEAIRGDLIRQALTDKIVADATEQPTVQRNAREIFISSADYKGPGDEAKVRHILYTPNDQEPGQASPLPSDDPAWAAAKAKAQTTYDKLKALEGNPAELEKQYEAIATTDSKDTGSAASGGQLPYYSRSEVDRGFGDAIFKEGLKKGDLLPPVQSQYGWHVILFEDRRQDPQSRINGLAVQANPTNFAELARNNSDGAEAANGGDLGWIAHDQIDAQREKAIFDAPIGKISDILTTDSGYYLFDVLEEQTRKAAGDQLATLKSSAFVNWYAAEKANADISTSSGSTTS